MAQVCVLYVCAYVSTCLCNRFACVCARARARGKEYAESMDVCPLRVCPLYCILLYCIPCVNTCIRALCDHGYKTSFEKELSRTQTMKNTRLNCRYSAEHTWKDDLMARFVFRMQSRATCVSLHSWATWCCQKQNIAPRGWAHALRGHCGGA